MCRMPSFYDRIKRQFIIKEFRLFDLSIYIYIRIYIYLSIYLNHYGVFAVTGMNSAAISGTGQKSVICSVKQQARHRGKPASF